jgi:hypothetical protein
MDVAVVFGVFLVLAVVGAVLWWQLVDLPMAMLSNGRVVIAPNDLTQEIGIDGWYALIALAGGLLAGAGLTAWRRTDPLVTVAAIGLAAVLAGWVMRALGQLLGPANPVTALKGAHSGATAPVRLVLHASGVVWLWPTAAALGALVWLYLASGPRSERRAGSVPSSTTGPAAAASTESHPGTPRSD